MAISQCALYPKRLVVVYCLYVAYLASIEVLGGPPPIRKWTVFLFRTGGGEPIPSAIKNLISLIIMIMENPPCFPNRSDNKLYHLL